MNNTALGLALAITLLLCHMYLETKTTELVDSLEVASIKFLNTVVERRAQTPRVVPSAAAATAAARQAAPARTPEAPAREAARA
jgi:hypothetical protein